MSTTTRTASSALASASASRQLADQRPRQRVAALLAIDGEASDGTVDLVAQRREALVGHGPDGSGPRSRGGGLGTVCAVVMLALAVLAGLVVGLARPPAGLHTVRPRVEQIGLLARRRRAQRAVGAPRRHRLAGRARRCRSPCSSRWPSPTVTSPGVAVVGVGLLVNLVGGGGQRRHAGAGRAPSRPPGSSSAGEPIEVDDPRHLETSDDPLPVLGDVLPVPFAHEVISFGDLIVVVGAADAVRELSRRRARVAGRRGGSAPAAHGAARGSTRSGAPRRAARRCRPPSTPRTPSAPRRRRIDLTSAEPATSEPELVAASHSR